LGPSTCVSREPRVERKVDGKEEWEMERPLGKFEFIIRVQYVEN
jgi:hypothetical protein